MKPEKSKVTHSSLWRDDLFYHFYHLRLGAQAVSLDVSAASRNSLAGAARLCRADEYAL